MVALWCAACGVQGPPQPPRIEQPERVTDLNAIQVGKTIRLSFTLPRNATDGERLTKPQEMEILRAMGSDAELKPWRTFSSEEAGKLVHGKSIRVTVPFDTDIHPPATLQFAVRTVTRGFRNRPFRGEISPEAAITLLNVPEAPQNLQATVFETAIKLNWVAPGEPPTSYRVFRSLSGDPDSFTRIGEPTEPAFEDAEFVFGRRYFYRVSAVVKDGGSEALSDDSQIVEVVPRDTFAPGSPRGLTAVFTTEFVELIWNANAEADLGGYFVYRQTEGGGETRLNPEPLSTPIHRDTAVEKEKSYTYRVTAVDAAGNESSPSEGVTAETR